MNSRWVVAVWALLAVVTPSRGSSGQSFLLERGTLTMDDRVVAEVRELPVSVAWTGPTTATVTFEDNALWLAEEIDLDRDHGTIYDTELLVRVDVDVDLRARGWEITMLAGTSARA